MILDTARDEEVVLVCARHGMEPDYVSRVDKGGYKHKLYCSFCEEQGVENETDYHNNINNAQSEWDDKQIELREEK